MNKKIKEYLKSCLREKVLEEGTPIIDFNKKNNWLIISLLFIVFVTSVAYINKASNLHQYMTIGKGVDLPARIHKATQEIIYGTNAQTGAASCPDGIYDSVRRACYGKMVGYEAAINADPRPRLNPDLRYLFDNKI